MNIGIATNLVECISTVFARVFFYFISFYSFLQGAGRSGWRFEPGALNRLLLFKRVLCREDC